MAIKKEGIQPKPSFLKSPAIPLVLIAASFTVALLAQAGYINLPHFGPNSRQDKSADVTPVEAELDDDTFKMDDGIIGVPYDGTFTFTVKDGPSEKFKDFYIYDPTEGLPPGLSIDKDGNILGKPTKEGTYNFGICAEDEGGYNHCMPASMTVIKEPIDDHVEGHICPTKPNPPCHSVQDGGEIPVQAEGMLVYDYCRCPDSTHDSGTRDTISTPGTVYKICICD